MRKNKVNHWAKKKIILYAAAQKNFHTYFFLVVIEETVEVTEEAMEEDAEEFTFNLFSNQKVSTVKIADEKDNTDHWSKVVADQQEHEFDETDPEFLSRVNQVVVDYETILKQSTVPYPTLRLPHRVLDLSKQKEEPKKVSTVKKRKSKKCRDFEKAVKEGKIKLKPNMRKSEDGWPGYPGNLTRVAIVDYQPGGKKKFGNTRGGFNSSSSSSNRGRGGIIRGNSRGGSGGMMARGNSRGGSGFSGRGKSF